MVKILDSTSLGLRTVDYRTWCLWGVKPREKYTSAFENAPKNCLIMALSCLNRSSLRTGTRCCWVLDTPLSGYELDMCFHLLFQKVLLLQEILQHLWKNSSQNFRKPGACKGCCSLLPLWILTRKHSFIRTKDCDKEFLLHSQEIGIKRNLAYIKGLFSQK